MISEMRHVLQQIFRPNDGSARAIQAAVNDAMQESKQASDRLVETVRELMERNDTITGRKRNVHKSGK